MANNNSQVEWNRTTAIHSIDYKENTLGSCYLAEFVVTLTNYNLQQDKMASSLKMAQDETSLRTLHLDRKFSCGFNSQVMANLHSVGSYLIMIPLKLSQYIKHKNYT